MSLKLKLVLIIIMLGFILYICRSISKNKISIKHSFIWLMVSFFTILSIVFVDFIFDIANLLGIEKASNMLFFLAIVFLAVICFSLSCQLSFSNSKILKLTQEISILKKDIKKVKSNDTKE